MRKARVEARFEELRAHHCAVVTLPDEISRALAQRLGHPPAALGRECANR